MHWVLGFHGRCRARKFRAFVVLATLWGSALIALTAGPSHADDVVISVAPATLELTLIPGSVASQEITVPL